MFSRGPDEIGCGHAIRDDTLELLHLPREANPYIWYEYKRGLWCEWLCARAFVHLCQCVYAGGVCVRTHSGVIDCVSEFESEFALSCGINRRCRLRGIDSSLISFILARVRTAIVVFMVRGGAC